MKKLTPKEVRDLNYCSKHPEYKAKKKPTTGCDRCLNKFYRFTLTPPSSAKTKKIRVAIVLDASGSMRGALFTNAIKALNRNIATFQEQSKLMGIPTTLSLFTFNNTVQKMLDNIDIHNVPHFDLLNFATPHGGTALFDATHEAADSLEQRKVEDTEDVSYLLIVITDGEENASRTTGPFLAQRLLKLQATDRWTATFLLPPGRKNSFSIRYGIPDGNLQEWEQTAQGIEQYATQVNRGINNYYASVSSGKMSTKTFFTDLSNVTAKQVQQKLDDISGEVKVWSVDRGEVAIKDFCEEKSKKPYLKGAAFYSLTKDEKLIQAYKKILIMEKNRREVYEGAAARQLLGLPVTGNVKVKPGNHSNFDVYVQSTSANRKLVRGTKVVYWPRVGTPWAASY